ncbi:MAG TPA: cytochrome c peroxidase [Polyangia bacterium]|nr:cytochrome c peroxidase [Polyangia bacterium]
MVGATAVGVARADDDPASLAKLGRAIFFDAALSEPRGTSCSSCHDPARAFSGVDGSTNGLPRGSRPGHFARRTSPSLLYLELVPTFRLAQTGDDPAPAPVGGFFWDGRADSVRALARQPLLNPDEMNNADGRALAVKVRRADYGAAFARAFPGALDDPEATLGAIGRALEAFLVTDDMAPFSSRYDAYLRKRGTLTSQELRGLALFKDERKGNCAGCHLMDDGVADPKASPFTDFSYDAVGVPRNARAPRRSPDLGLCERRDTETPTREAAYCASFRTPSLRNVAVRASYMHNGAFTSLRDVVAYYATRGTSPRRWYKGEVFDDVPRRYRGAVNTRTPPYDRRPGDAPALDDAEIDAVVAFLGTLTDLTGSGSLPLANPGPPRGAWRSHAPLAPRPGSSRVK